VDVLRAEMTSVSGMGSDPEVGRCRLIISKPVLKVLMVSALEATI